MTVYFAAADGRLKAGYTSSDVAKRLLQISAHLAHPLVLIGSIDGDIGVERAAQKALSRFHLKGEWFQDCAATRGIVQSILTGQKVLTPIEPKDKKPLVAVEVLPENRRRARHHLLNSIWPGDYLTQLSALLDEPKEIIALWLSDEVDMPDRIRLALSGLFFPLLMTGKLPAFDQASKIS